MLQNPADKARDTFTNTGAQGTKNAQDALKPNQETSGTKSLSGPGSTSGASSIMACLLQVCCMRMHISGKEKAVGQISAAPVCHTSLPRLMVYLWWAAGRRVTTPPDDKSFVQQAKEGIAAAAAVTADKASQAYQ